MFTAPSIHGPAGLKGLDGLATLGSLALLPTAFTARFGRVARSYPAMPRHRAHLWSPLSARSTLRTARQDGLAPAGARLFARVLAWLAQAAERRGQQWARARERRLTEHALHQLDGHTLRDIGLSRSEISSMAAEAAGEVEATRSRVWREIGCRVV
ncbi:MAG: DUF1127 domain-containing protein [Rubrivivax sp.]|nr:DUF1127 domain-containing protein [Rubrivivax sp.]